MYRIIFLLILFSFLSGCKQEAVDFYSSNENERVQDVPSSPNPTPVEDNDDVVVEPVVPVDPVDPPPVDPPPSPFVEKVTSVNVEVDYPLADILFVIDNSISMQEEQLEVAQRIDQFFNKIDNLDWRVAIITTDPYEFEPVGQQEDPYADGALLAFPNGDYFIDASMDLMEARNQFSQTIFRPEEGNGHERGIRNTLRTLERYQSSSLDPKNQRIQNFYRQDASLSVVLISDENETLVNGIGVPFDDTEKSDPLNLYESVKNLWGVEKKFQWNSVVVREGDQSCIGSNESFGVTYEQMSRLTGGVIEDICADDYSGALNKIGNEVASLEKTFKLDCEPQDINNDAVVDLQVTSKEGNLIPNYLIKMDSIEFETPLLEGEYRFTYHCLK